MAVHVSLSNSAGSQRTKPQFELGSYATSANILNPIFGTVPLKKYSGANPLTKEESWRVYKCDDECLSGSTKRWIFKSMWNI